MRSEPMPTGWPPVESPDDGTAWREDGTPEGGAIAGLMFCLAVALVVAVALIAWGSS